jgi:hypothetical protein
VPFAHNRCPAGLDRDPDLGDIDSDKSAAVFPRQNAARFHGFSAQTIKAEDPVRLGDREPPFDIREFAAIGLARTNVPDSYRLINARFNVAVYLLDGVSLERIADFLDRRTSQVNAPDRHHR